MKFAVTYHIFSRFPQNKIKVWEMEEAPFIVSIATVRANSDVPIYVMDLHPESHDWGDYPEKLNFKVVPWQGHQFPDAELETPCGNKWMVHRNKYTLQRLFDVEVFSRQIPERYVLHSDPDIFWLDDILPLNVSQDKFCFSGTKVGERIRWANSGLYFFDKESVKAQAFIDSWKSIISKGVYDIKFADNMIEYVLETCPNYWEFCCETCLIYTSNLDTSLVDLIPCEDVKYIGPNVLNIHNTKAVHLNSFAFNKQLFKKLPFCFEVDQFYNVLKKVFTKEDFKKIHDIKKYGAFDLKDFYQWKNSKLIVSI